MNINSEVLEVSSDNTDWGIRYKKTDKNHPANFPPGTPRFPSTQGVCDFCHRMLSRSDRDLTHHYNTILALFHSSLSCPCCSILFQSFHRRAVDIETALLNARFNDNGVVDGQHIDLEISAAVINDDCSVLNLWASLPSAINEKRVMVQGLYFCTSEGWYVMDLKEASD